MCHTMVRRETPPPGLFNILSADAEEVRQKAQAPDLWLLPCRSVDEIPKKLFEMAFLRMPQFARHVLEIPEDRITRSIQILTPRRTKHALGSDALNPLFRSALAETGGLKINENFVFSPGDRVIQVKNDYKLDIFNGDTGTVLGVDQGSYNIMLDTGTVKKVPTKSNNLQFAYALTIHKSQGSEWPIVILPVHSTLAFNFDRPLLYTALSRASALCMVVGQFRDFANIGTTPGSITRKTGLAERIQHYLKQT